MLTTLSGWLTNPSRREFAEYVSVPIAQSFRAWIESCKRKKSELARPPELEVSSLGNFDRTDTVILVYVILATNINASDMTSPYAQFFWPLSTSRESL